MKSVDQLASTKPETTNKRGETESQIKREGKRAEMRFINLVKEE